MRPGGVGIFGDQLLEGTKEILIAPLQVQLGVFQARDIEQLINELCEVFTLVHDVCHCILIPGIGSIGSTEL